VSAEPTCVTHQLSPDDRFALMASDGLWDVMSDEEAQAFVLAADAQGASPTAIAQQLIQAALNKGTRDNVSALLIRF